MHPAGDDTAPRLENVLVLYLGLEAMGIRLKRTRRAFPRVGWQLSVDGRESTLTPEIVARIKRNRAGLMDLLRSLEQGARRTQAPSRTTASWSGGLEVIPFVERLDERPKPRPTRAIME